MQNEEHKRSITSDDMFRVRWVDEPCLSPDGQRLAYSVTYLDRERDAMLSQITCGGWSHAGHSPRWSPDGTQLAFICRDDESAHTPREQVWIWDTRCQRAAPITHLPDPCFGGDAKSCVSAWSPDGKHIAFIATKRLWVVATDSTPPVALTEAHEAIATPCWLSDGRGIVFTTSHRMGSETQVWSIQLDLPTPPSATLLCRNPGPIRAITCAPDGSALAWIGHDRGLAQGVNFGVWAFSFADQCIRPLTAAFDRSAGLTTRADDARGMNPPDLVWVHHDGHDRIYFAYAEGGSSHIGWVGLDGSMQPIVTGARSCLSFSIAPHANTLACVIADAANPGEIVALDLDGNDERRLTDVNAVWLGEVRLSAHEPLHFVASDGVTVEAWLVKPPLAGLDSNSEGGCHPLILQIHGGPHYAIGNRFYLEFQRLAAQGYMVLFGNARGSQGYGERFATCIRTAWGVRDYEDLMHMLDRAMNDPLVDPTRLAVTGVSYGGFMTHCIIGRTRRFRVAITENGISNLAGNYARTTNQLFWEWQMDGTPATQPERYRALSPIQNANEVRTPLLLIHAEQDENCPIEQSEEMLAALQANGCAARLVRIPEEGHLMNLVGKPSHRALRTRVLDEWLAHWLAG